MRYLMNELNKDDNKEMLKRLDMGSLVINLSCHSSGFGHVNFTRDEIIEDIIEFFK